MGLALGAIPLAAGYVARGVAANNSVTAAAGLLDFTVVLYFIAWMVALAFLVALDSRLFGLGMLAALLASPVIFFVSCTAIFRLR